MSIVNKVIGAVLIVLLIPAATAQRVYQSTNEDGVVEFSDQPGSGANEVNVNPNVIETTPAPEVETYKRPEKKQPATPAPTVVESQTETQTVIDRNPRLRRKVVERRNDPGPAVTPQPAPTPAPRPR